MKTTRIFGLSLMSLALSAAAFAAAGPSSGTGAGSGSNGGAVSSQSTTSGSTSSGSTSDNSGIFTTPDNGSGISGTYRADNTAPRTEPAIRADDFNTAPREQPALIDNGGSGATSGTTGSVGNGTVAPGIPSNDAVNGVAASQDTSIRQDPTHVPNGTAGSRPAPNSTVR